MSSQALLLPSLYALLPASSLQNLLAHLSLLSIHVEPYFLHDTIYTASVSVLPGQPRSVRLRSIRRRHQRRHPHRPRIDLGKGEEVAESGADWDHSLVYLSNPLNGREYSEMSVRACLNVDVASMESRTDIESFVEALGMSKPYSYTQTGTLFHLPLSPTSTIHITVMQINNEPFSSATTAAAKPDPRKSYVVEMKPARPVGAVGSRDQMSLQNVMTAMRNLADRIEGLEWSSGRQQ